MSVTQSNEAVAGVLEEITLRLQIQGAQVFKIRAFRRAAEVISGHHEVIAQVAEQGRLTEIGGIGKSIAVDIQQIVARGTCDALEALRAEMPQDILDLLKVQGLGPKRVKMIWEQLGVDDLPSLEEAAKRGDIAKLKGLGAKTQANILKEIERIQRMDGRTVIGQALPQAEAIRDHLGAREDVLQIEIAGSLRRRADTVGDLDLVIASETSESMDIMNALVAYDETADIIAHGRSKTSVRLRSGIQVDLRVVQPHQWGSALHHFTGSYQHHIQLRARAKARGLKINEYGVFKDGSEDPIAGRDEASIYAALDLPWLPPELRQGRGEVEAALAGTLPELISIEDIRGDLHMHTVETDGVATVREMGEAAKAKGYEYICITDHSKAVSIANGMNAERMSAHAKHIREVDAELEGIRVLTGVEVDILRDGSLDLPEAQLAELDFVVASVHSSFSLSEKAMTERVLCAIRSGVIHAIGHPTGRLLGSRDPFALDMEVIIAAALEHGVALEINASPSRLDLNDIHARMVREAGVKVIISSDAHSVRGLEVMPFGVNVARRAWLDPSQVLNAQPLEAWFGARG